MNLLQILFAFVICYIKQEHPVKDLSNSMSQANQEMLMKLIPAMKPFFQAYNNGKEIDYYELSDLVSRFTAAYLKQPEAKQSYADYLKTFAAWFKNGSATSLAKLEKLSTRMHDPAIPASFTKDEIDQGPIKEQVTKLVKKLGGKGQVLTPDESKKAKEKNPELYKTYLGLRRQYSESWKTALSNYVRSSGKSLVPFKEIEDYFKSLGIEHTMPTGFTGKIDAKGAWYTSDDKEIQGVPAVALFPSVRMNPRPKETPWVFQVIRNTGEPDNYFYTLEFQHNQAKKKFAKVANFNPDSIRGEWRAMINHFDFYNPKTVAAVIIELLYRSSHRIGTVGGNATGGGFGICTIQVRHYYPQSDGGFKFIYLGKDDVKFTYKMSPHEDPIAKKICEIVKEMAENKKPRDALFTYWTKSGMPKHITPAVVNAEFGSMSGGITVHKLRTYRGTKMFRDYLAQVFAKRTNVTSGDAMMLLKKGAILVGKELNHVKRSADGSQEVTPNTALKNYIDPDAQAELFQYYNLPLPTSLEKLLGKGEIASLITAETDGVKPVMPVEPIKQTPSPKPVQPVHPAKPVEPTKPTALPVDNAAPVTPQPQVQQPAPVQQAQPPQQPMMETPPLPGGAIDDDGNIEEPPEIVLDPRMERYLAGDIDLWEDSDDFF